MIALVVSSHPEFGSLRLSTARGRGCNVGLAMSCALFEAVSGG